MPQPIPSRFLLAAAGGMLLLSAPARAATPEQVRRGEYLTQAGDCAACHTAPGGAPFAGGLAINSPFGTLYASNITPDKDTGIGGWTDDQFYAALHDGIGAGGEHLYPAMPYQWYTKVTRQDVDDIRAYLATVPAVNAAPKKNTMMFPFNVRAGIAAWNTAYFKAGEFKPDPVKSAEVNRGAYLVEGLGHCSDCHTPKSVSAAPIESRAYSGGLIDNWYAPNITSDHERGIGAWPPEQVVQYLKTGKLPGKASVVGPMAQVVSESMSHMTDADLHAIAAYLGTIPPIADYKDVRPASLTGPNAQGASTYLTYCASCHQQDGRGLTGAVPALDGDDVVRAKGPQNVIRVILGGHMASGNLAVMPAVGADMTDAEIADVTNYVRTAWSNAAPATAEPGMAGEIRKATTTLLSGPGTDRCRDPETAGIKPLEDAQVGAILHQITAANMPDSVDRLVVRVQQVAGQTPRADLVNALTVQYCSLAGQGIGAGNQTGAAAQDAAARRMLTRFTQLVFTRLSSNEPVGRPATKPN